MVGSSQSNRSGYNKNAIRVHHGAVDQTTVTTGSPPEVMAHVTKVLLDMGLEVQQESEYKYRCIRSKRKKVAASSGVGSVTALSMMPSPASHEPIFGDRTEDQGDEVRFSVELTRIDGLQDMFSIDIRRLKGNLRSYKFLYDTLRE
ncbi:uncharacterized protein FOMMEDRAFT_80756 [Fomitiporia mediterranea MF3/22]|uniref:uncharacterized protein n=1 Tax=Fomitiporia mediterranea (strain MF3/22) TaxID=694068 RepID=UPI0004409BC8|nr:uncharacterized protein FOMMEDRAFT_80756 [Fomitiporia mediterranea MF3/22]EJD05099.1 hypothetical protein FOMMEDRAFT_80756 [Fomitiporia mediterranea MF3/22]